MKITALALTPGLLLVSLAGSAQPGPSDAKQGLGRTETITGNVVHVLPEQNLVVLSVRGDTSTSTIFAERHARVYRNGQTVTQADQSGIREGPGETYYNFRVDCAAFIRLNRQAATLSKLTKFENRQATVRFVPHRDGNFALGIEAGD